MSIGDGTIDSIGVEFDLFDLQFFPLSPYVSFAGGTTYSSFLSLLSLYPCPNRHGGLDALLTGPMEFSTAKRSLP